MLGIPGETREDAIKTMRMVKYTKRILPSISFYAPYPGSALGHQLIAEGKSLMTKENYHRFPDDEKVKGIDYAFYRELLAVLQAPLSAEDLAIEPIPAPLGNAQKRALVEMKDAVAAIALATGIPDTLLCPRRHLEALLTDRLWPAALEGWRKPLLHEPLMRLMP